MPGVIDIVPGSLVWAILMVCSAWLGLALRGWQASTNLYEVCIVFFVGGLLAFLPGLWVGRIVARGRAAHARFATVFVALLLATLGMTAVVYALQYRQYYSQWHEDVFTRIWMFQLIFTFAAAIYQFAVLGMRLFVPVGFIALVAAALYYARRID